MTDKNRNELLDQLFPDQPGNPAWDAAARDAADNLVTKVEPAIANAARELVDKLQKRDAMARRRAVNGPGHQGHNNSCVLS